MVINKEQWESLCLAVAALLVIAPCLLVDPVHITSLCKPNRAGNCPVEELLMANSPPRFCFCFFFPAKGNAAMNRIKIRTKMSLNNNISGGGRNPEVQKYNVLCLPHSVEFWGDSGFPMQWCSEHVNNHQGPQLSISRFYPKPLTSHGSITSNSITCVHAKSLQLCPTLCGL